MMRQRHERIFLAIAAGIGLGFFALSDRLTLAAFNPQNQAVSNSNTFLAQSTRRMDKNSILAAHNKYRQKLGVAPLKWSDTVAQSAQQWANQLAKSRQFQHSTSRRYGENLWMGTSGYFSFTQMVDGWGSEQKDFSGNGTFPDVSTTGQWQDVGHYTQMIWKNTTEVGCGLASGGGNDYLVCQYNPPGNVIGQKIY